MSSVNAAIDRFFEQRECIPSVEPCEEEFLSPTLLVAALQASCKPSEEFYGWFIDYLPSLPSNLLEPLHVDDESDPKRVHHAGLNLSRAWCFGLIARAFAEVGDDAYLKTMEYAARKHLTTGIRSVFSPEYAGTHWLYTYALLALLERPVVNDFMAKL